VTRWLITGAAGQLGTHLVSQLGDAHADAAVVALARAELDITSAAAVDEAVRSARPDVVINTAAYTAVDAAETDEETAYAVNATGPQLLATALAQHGGRLIHVSTDYVFDGTADRA
jgi:dTDP-4-dehydrorhamnose reductase